MTTASYPAWDCCCPPAAHDTLTEARKRVLAKANRDRLDPAYITGLLDAEKILSEMQSEVEHA